MSLWSTLGGAVGSFFGGPVGGAAGSAIGGHFDGNAKVPGIPTPQAGTQVGQNRLAEMDAAFPGTTSWERLGSSSNQAGVPSAETQGRSAAIMQSRELSNRSDIADRTNRAHIVGALGGVSPMAASSGLDLYNRGVGGSYDTTTAQGRDRLHSDVDRNYSAANRDRVEAKIAPHANPWRTFTAGSPDWEHVRLRSKDAAVKFSKYISGRRKPVFGA